MGDLGKLTSNSYTLMAAQQETAAAAAHGTVEIPDQHGGRQLPSVTRDEALELVEYWLDQAVRNLAFPSGTFPDWMYAVTKLALGYRKPGDKFKADKLFDLAFAQSLLPAEGLPTLWDGVQTTAALLNGLPTPVRKPPRAFAMSTHAPARWKRLAQLAWGRMKKERAQEGVPDVPFPIPDLPPKLPPPFDDPGNWMPKLPSATGILLLLGLVALAWSDRGSEA